MTNRNNLKEISEAMIKRYSDRYKSLGYNIKTLGWGNDSQQTSRFSQTLSADIDFNGQTILDIGCGFGDYYNFLKKNNIDIKKYIGWDINEDLISEAKTRNSGFKNVEFGIADLTHDTIDESVADIGVMLGVLNLNLKERFNNYEYSRLIINNAYRKVSKLLIVDFLSTNLTKGYPKEDFVFYHDPAVMLNTAFELSPNVVLKHNYQPIPQKDFMLFIYK